MFNIKELLTTLRSLTPPHYEVRNALISAVREVTGVVLSTDDIKVSRQMIYLHIHPLKKSNLYLMKYEILDRTNKILEKSGRHVTDLR